jgi:hypothetical protein
VVVGRARMPFLRLALLLLAAVFGLIAPAHAIEGPAAAGPIGGTDIRSAMLPPPGLYGGTFALAAEAYTFSTVVATPFPR